MFLDNIYNKTLEFIDSVSKQARKEKGQFFTSKAVSSFMAGLSTFNKTKINICDCGAGTGILTAALCEKLVESKTCSIHIDLYENDEFILPLLKQNMEFIQQIMNKNGKRFTYQIIPENFILFNKHIWLNESENTKYDIIISNPPYKKLSIESIEPQIMKNIVKGQPNIYFLFLGMSARLLNKNGEMIFINPRSFTTGAYFKEFRKWFMKNVKITDLHLFESRDEVFDSDKILQESVIIRAVKTSAKPNNINVSSCINLQLNNIKSHCVPYNIIIDEIDDNCFIRIPSNKEQIEIIKTVHTWRQTLISLGFKLKTGPVVDFRTKENLIYKENESNLNKVPLFWSCNINENKITHPVKSDKPQWVLKNDATKGILLDNKDYIILKRFTSKEESRRIQAVIYEKDEFLNNKIGLENHMNYITKLNGIFSKQELYGLFVILNTTLMDNYFRILNGSTQVNANEMNSIPLPELSDLECLGERAMKLLKLTVDECDKLVCDYFVLKNNVKPNNILMTLKSKNNIKTTVNF